MWKIVVAFIAFAALALFILTKSGGNIDLGGESHGISSSHEPAPAASEAASAAVTAAVEAASMPASAASQ